MRTAYFSPMPPARTGVAHYSSMLLPELSRHLDLTVNPDRWPASDPAFYQLGNNPQHEFVYRAAMEQPGVVVLHDVVLHHLIVEMTLARGDSQGYIEAMRANHGPMGVAWARGRMAGMHDELANFLLPASIDIANRSRAVIVHNQYAAERLRSFGVRTPLLVVPHPHRSAGRHAGGNPESGLIGFFGFLTSAKRAEVVIEAFARARRKDARLRLLIVGEAAPNIGAMEGEGITVTGYVSEEEFDACYERVDRLVNLRYPSAGESSGTLIRAFQAGKPVAVSDYAQFAELPDDVVTKIPFGSEEVSRLTEFFLRHLPSPAAAQRRWLEENASMDRTVSGYLQALDLAGTPPRSLVLPAAAGVPLFPMLTMAWDGEVVTLRNEGQHTLRAAEYGQPGYRAVLKTFHGSTQSGDHWLQLPSDLLPGESVRIGFRRPGDRLTLTHALEGIPIVDERPALEVERSSVR